MKKVKHQRSVDEAGLLLSQKDLLAELGALAEAEQKRKQMIEGAEQRFKLELGGLNFDALVQQESKKLLSEKQDRLKKAKHDAEVHASSMEKEMADMVQEVGMKQGKNIDKAIDMLLSSLLS